MNLLPISVACPQCGSRDVFYSCKPECCFNHVCNTCYATFELETERVGEITDPFDVPPDPESTNPTAPCARCGESRVFAVAKASAAPDRYVCVACKALLSLSFTNVANT